jgi:cell division protease FtsH
MENNKNKKTQNPKFNIYWIYGIVISILLGMSFFGGDSNFKNIGKTNISEFEKYLNEGDIKEIIVINKNLAQISLKEDVLSKSEHQRVKSKNFLGQDNIKGPHYQFEVGNLELFQRKLEKAEEKGIDFKYEFNTIENKWLDVIIGFLPIIIIIGVWIFLMRRMSGGGAGGAGGQIFNIGKSKAQMFGQGKSTNVTFAMLLDFKKLRRKLMKLSTSLKVQKSILL